MEKVKTIVDREPVSSDYIGSKQNFGQVLSQVKNLKPPIWKTAWFYGPVGVAVIAITLSVTTIDPISALPENSKTPAHELKAYLNETTPIPTNKNSRKAEVRSVKKVNASFNVDNSTKISSSNLKEAKEVPFIAQEIEGEPEIRSAKMQDEHVRINKNFLPHFQGNYTGDISIEKLCSENGIECNDEIRVIAFNIQYYTGSKDRSSKVVGNKIPQDVCDMIASHNIGNMIFITDIKGVNMDGQVVNLTSLNYRPTN